MSTYWSQYWSEGKLTSFGESKADNYPGAIKDSWLSFFKEVGKDDRVLDIGTGNGALISLAIENSLGEGACFTGIDYANINVQSPCLIKNERLKFLSSTTAEELPFADESYTHVVSQYALEYTNVKKSVAELSRVLKQAGAFQFVCHVDESVVIRINKEILKSANAVKAKGGSLEITKKLVAKLQQTKGRGTAESEELRNRLNAANGKLIQKNKDAFQLTGFPVLISNLFTSKRFLEGSEPIKEYERELKGLILRLSDLVEASLSEKGRARLLHFCEVNSLNVEASELLVQLDGNIVGLLVKGHKASS